MPIPDTATIRPDVVCEETEGDHGADEEEEVDGPVQEGGSKGEEEEQTEEDSDSGDYFGIDEALL